MLELDGSLGEGGGQILRTSLALSLITGKPFHLRNIRAGRQKPGLRPQHLMCVRAAATIGHATVVGDVLGSMDLIFEPGEVVAGKYRFDIGTAGASSLLFQTLYLPLCLRTASPSEVVLVGGTHVPKSPCFQFLDKTWRKAMELIGLNLELRLCRPGFFPRGGGVIEARLQPCSNLKGVAFVERTPVKNIQGFSAVACLPEDIASRQARHVMKSMGPSGVKVTVRSEKWEGGPGTVVGLELESDPIGAFFFALGARGKPAKNVADEAAQEAIAYLKATPAVIDPYTADQIVLPLSLASDPSSFTLTAVTSHLLTNVAVIRHFVDRDVACTGDIGSIGSVRIH